MVGINPLIQLLKSGQYPKWIKFYSEKYNKAHFKCN